MPVSASASRVSSSARSNGRALGRALDLDEPAVGGLDDVHVHVGARVLVVGQVEHRRAGDDADARGRDVVGDRHARDRPCSRSRSSASTSATNPPVIEAVRVPPSAWMTSQSIQIVRSPSSVSDVIDRSDRPMSRWISCVRPPTLPAVASRVRPRGRRARQHAVFGRDPALAGAAQERRHAVLDRRRADHFRQADLDHHRAFGVNGDARGEPRRPHRVVRRPSCRVMRLLSFRTHSRALPRGYRRSMCPASVSTCLPSTRICTAAMSGRLTVIALTMA